MKSRVDDAVKMFESGFNCCQSILATYSDIFGLDKETALKLASPIGGGIAKTRNMCGTVVAMALLVGLKEGNVNPNATDIRTEVNEHVRAMMERFTDENGSVICGELLKGLAVDNSSAPSPRTAEYYGTRPCSKLVANAANIVEDMILDDIVD